MDIRSLSSWALWVLTAIAAYLGAYAAEKGKRRAAKEDSEAILAELGRTTRAIKEIEAAISLNVWQEQKRWDERRDSFALLLVWLDKIYAGILAIPSDSHKLSMPARLQAVLEPLGPDFRQARAIASIFLPPRCIKPIIGMFNDLLDTETRDDALHVCVAVRDEFTESARAFFSAPELAAELREAHSAKAG